MRPAARAGAVCSGRRTVAMTVAPPRRATATAARPTAPTAPVTTTVARGTPHVLPEAIRLDVRADRVDHPRPVAVRDNARKGHH